MFSVSLAIALSMNSIAIATGGRVADLRNLNLNDFYYTKVVHWAFSVSGLMSVAQVHIYFPSISTLASCLIKKCTFHDSIVVVIRVVALSHCL